MALVQTTGKVLLNGFDLSAYLRQVTHGGEGNVIDATAFDTQGARSFKVGVFDRSVSGEGFFAYDETLDANSIDKLFHDTLAASQYPLFMIGMNGVSVGDVAHIFTLKQAKYQISETVGELIMTNFEAKASLESTTNKAYARGLWMMSQSVTGTTNGSTYDSLVTNLVGYYAQCHVTDPVSLTSMTVKVQHSTNGSDWTDLVTFSNFTAKGAEAKFNTATALNRYVRAIVSAFTGTSAKVNVAISLGFTG